MVSSFPPQREVCQAKKKIYFVLLSAPWSVLCYYAEEISLRVPLQVRRSSSAAVLPPVDVLSACPLSCLRSSPLRSLTGPNSSCPSCRSRTPSPRRSPTHHLTTTPVSSGPTSWRGSESQSCFTCSLPAGRSDSLGCPALSVCRFLGSEDKNTFFKTTQRHQVVSSGTVRHPTSRTVNPPHLQYKHFSS